MNIDNIINKVFNGEGFLTNDAPGISPFYPRSHIVKVNPKKLLNKQPKGYYDIERLSCLVDMNIDICKDNEIVLNEYTQTVESKKSLKHFLLSNKDFRFVKYAFT